MNTAKCLMLEDSIVAMYNNLHKDYNLYNLRMDIGITLMKMSDSQKEDLHSMIEYFKSTDQTVSYILGNVMHDLNGLKNEFINGPCGFSPRFTSYHQ